MGHKKQTYGMIKLNEFDFNRDISKTIPFTSFIIAPKNCGKSLLLKTFLHSQRNRFLYGLLASQTEGQTGFFKEFCPKSLIRIGYKPSYPERLLKRGEQLSERRVTPDKKQTLLLADDCLTDLKRNDEATKKCFFNGRHYGISTVITSQYPSLIPNDWRENCDYFFIGPLRGNNARECMYKMVESIFPSKELFYNYLNKYTRNYKFLVVQLTTEGQVLEDSNSDDSFDLVKDVNNQIKTSVFWCRSDPKLKTKCFPDIYRDENELRSQYNAINKTLRKRGDKYQTLDYKTNQWKDINWQRK